MEKRIRVKLVDLESKGIHSVYVDVDLTDPLAPEAVERLQGLGFFFSGLLPDYSTRGDVLRLQLYNTTVDYGEIHAFSPFAIRQRACRARQVL